MLFDQGFSWRLGPLEVNGFSAASRVTWYAFPSLDLVVDIGWCIEPMRQLSRLFLSHLHQDHSLALSTWVAWRQRATPFVMPTVYTHHACVEEARALIDSFARASRWTLQYEVLGLKEGDRVDLGKGYSLEVFETPHHIPTLGFLLYQKENKLKPAFRGLPSEEIQRLIREKVEIREVSEAKLLCYTADTTPELFDRRPDLLQVKILLVECSYLDGYLEYNPEEKSALGEKEGVTHCHIRPLSQRLSGFRGEVLALTHLPRKYEGCDLYPYLLPRLPKEQRRKLVVAPYRDPQPRTEIVTRAPPSLPALAKEICYEPKEAWEVRERPGHFGFKKEAILQRLSAQYPGFVLAWQCGEKLLRQESALALYEDAYFVFFQDNPELVDWLVRRASDVYDTHPSNMEAGLDYQAQTKGAPTHLQDIAIRRALLRLGRWFEGATPLEVRGIRSEGYALQPGLIPFHKKELILTPELSSDWFLPGSVESFWQSNKVVLTPKEKHP